MEGVQCSAVRTKYSVAWKKCVTNSVVRRLFQLCLLQETKSVLGGSDIVGLMRQKIELGNVMVSLGSFPPSSIDRSIDRD